MRKLRSAIEDALLGPDMTKYPYAIGHFHGGTFAAEFWLGSDPTVRELPITLYGMGSVDAEPYLEKLLHSNNWVLEWR